MAIFQRISDILKANINDLIDRAENPEKMVKQIIIDMEEQLTGATQALGQAMASEKQAQRQLEQAKASSQDWENKAKMALQAGNEDLARRALESKVNVDKSIAQFQVTYDSISQQTAQMRDNVQVLRSKLDEARARQNLLIARSKMADAQKNIANSFSSTSSTSAFSKLDKMERKIEGKEAEAAAFSELAGDNMRSTMDEFKTLETNAAVDSELERLKQSLGK
jgi:phage shock protein A